MKFLQQVADYYMSRATDLHNTVFVFPNKRAAMFMRKYMRERSDRVTFLPRMVSITHFTQSYCESTLGSPYELLFILYNVYCDVLRSHGRESQVPDFDNFSFWGSILINDFSEIDAYMVDSDQIFRNLVGLKQIEANYLTPEQIRAIELLWGRSYAHHADTEEFWKHVPSAAKGEDLSGQFISLWMVMDELYRKFREKLTANRPTPMAYSGMQSREALDRIKSMSKGDFGGRRFVFIGFNVLSTARTLIFSELQKRGIAEFFWDTAFASALSPVKTHGLSETLTPALRFIMPLARRFPMPEDFCPEPVTAPADIEVLSVPSKVGQAKTAVDILRGWSEEWRAQGNPYHYEQHLLDTAIVLPDNSLLMPLLYSVPEDVQPVNVTMGVSYNSTPFAALMSAVIYMQINSRQSADGDVTYFYRDVEDVLTHTHVSVMTRGQALRLLQQIKRHRLFRVPASMITQGYPDLEFLFKPLPTGNDVDAVMRFVNELICAMHSRIQAHVTEQNPEGADQALAASYEIKMLTGYRKAVDMLCSLARKHTVGMTAETFFRLLEHELRSTGLNFTGQPLKGLQIMGVMDTRCLDFDNLMILSMNEGVYPKKNYTPSLIPAALRHGYYMPTQEHEESTSAYQFYRLMSRARRVRLIYDSRAKGLASGEMSRYISQWLHLEKESRIQFTTCHFPAVTPTPREITVHKTDPGVKEALERFIPGKGKLNISASALKTYLKCPLHFYLEYVKGLRVNQTVIEYIDAASYGTVLHAMAEHLYKRRKGEYITPQTLDEILLTTDLEGMARDELNASYYNHRYDGHLDRMPGEGKMIAKLMAKYIRMMLEKEKDVAAATPYVFEDAEFGQGEPMQWQVTPDICVNLHMSIDRIDSLPDGSLRFIDYKTGSDSLIATSLDKVFEDSKCHGIFQLLVYCHAYADITGFKGRIQPMIYKFQEITNGIVPLKLEKAPILDYHQADSDENGFRARFEHIIHSIFETEDEFPFTQAPMDKCDDSCLYCPFVQLCGRSPKRKY